MASSTLSTAISANSTPNTVPLIRACPAGSPERLANMTQPYCGIGLLSFDNASIAMRSCCNGADFMFPQDGCSVYCKVVGQTSTQLLDCLGGWARIQDNFGGTLCSSDAMATRGLNSLSKVIMVVMGLVTVTLGSELL